jgi:hypothetical protein
MLLFRLVNFQASKKLLEIEEIERSIDGAEALQLSQDKNLSISMLFLVLTMFVSFLLTFLARVGFVQIFHNKKKKLVPRKIYLFNSLILVVKRNESVMKKKNAKEFSLENSFYISNLVFSDMSNIAGMN